MGKDDGDSVGLVVGKHCGEHVRTMSMSTEVTPAITVARAPLNANSTPTRLMDVAAIPWSSTPALKRTTTAIVGEIVGDSDGAALGDSDG